jgi:hypothetical protein
VTKFKKSREEKVKENNMAKMQAKMAAGRA